MLGPNGLPWPGTPRLNEPMSRRKRLRYCVPTGFPVKLVGLRSVKISPFAGGEVKSFKLVVQFGPPWQFAQPAWVNNMRPIAMSDADAPFGRPASGAFGVRTAKRTHSRKAVRAGTLFALPGRVTLT